MERNIQLDWQGVVDAAVKMRKRERISQKELAALAGVSHPTVVRFEAGDEQLLVSSAMAILRVLGGGVAGMAAADHQCAGRHDGSR